MRSYGLGVGLFRLNPVDPDMWPSLIQVADTVLIQRHWQEVQNPSGLSFIDSLRLETEVARAGGLKVIAAMECLNVSRSEIDLPTSLSGRSPAFTDPQVRNALKATLREAAEVSQPDYFILCVEIDLHSTFNQASYEAFTELYPHLYQAVKTRSPNTKVGVSLTFRDVNGENQIDSQDEAIFQGQVGHFSPVDFLGVSTYPFCYWLPENIPANLLLRIASHSDKPLLITETGWMSQPFEIAPGVIFPASPEAQSAYVTKLRETADYCVSQGKAVAAITYVSLLDVSPDICAQLPAELSWYCTLALRDSLGLEKPAYWTMRDWRNS